MRVQKNKKNNLGEIDKEKEKVKHNKKSTAQNSPGDIRLDTIYKKIEKHTKFEGTEKKGRTNT